MSALRARIRQSQIGAAVNLWRERTPAKKQRANHLDEYSVSRRDRMRKEIRNFRVYSVRFRSQEFWTDHLESTAT